MVSVEKINYHIYFKKIKVPDQLGKKEYLHLSLHDPSPPLPNPYPRIGSRPRCHPLLHLVAISLSLALTGIPEQHRGRHQLGDDLS